MSAPPAAPTDRPVRRLGPGFAGFLSLVALGAAMFLGPFGVIGALFAPLPLAHFQASGRPGILAWGWVAVVLAGLALTDLPGATSVLLGYLLLAAWPAFSIELWGRARWETGRWAAIVTLGAFGMVSGFMLTVLDVADPARSLAALLQAQIEHVPSVAPLLGQGEQARETLATVVGLAARTMPGLLALLVLTSVMWLRPRLAMLGHEVGAQPFDEYRSEEWLPVAFAVAGLGWVFAPEPFKWLSGNLLLVVTGLYFVGGLAIILFYLGRRLGSNLWVRLLVALFALQAPVAVAFSVLGLADNFFTLRRRRVGNEGE